MTIMPRPNYVQVIEKHMIQQRISRLGQLVFWQIWDHCAHRQTLRIHLHPRCIAEVALINLNAVYHGLQELHRSGLIDWVSLQHKGPNFQNITLNLDLLSRSAQDDAKQTGLANDDVYPTETRYTRSESDDEVRSPLCFAEPSEKAPCEDHPSDEGLDSDAGVKRRDLDAQIQGLDRMLDSHRQSPDAESRAALIEDLSNQRNRLVEARNRLRVKPSNIQKNQSIDQRKTHPDRPSKNRLGHRR